MTKMVRIDNYTGAWQPALSPKPALRKGQRLMVADSPDDREWHDLKHAIPDGCSLEWERASISGWSIYRVVYCPAN